MLIVVDFVSEPLRHLDQNSKPARKFMKNSRSPYQNTCVLGVPGTIKKLLPVHCAITPFGAVTFAFATRGDSTCHMLGVLVHSKMIVTGESTI